MRVGEGKRGVLLGLIHGLVSDDQGLEVVAGIGNGLDELGGEDSVCNLGALAHDGDPEGKLRVILARSEREVITILAHALHEVLVHDSEDEAVEGAVGHLLAGAFYERGGDLGLLAVEHVGGGFQTLRRGGHALEEEREEELADAQKRVEALRQGQLEVDKGDILAAGRVRGVLVGFLLLQQVVKVELLLGARLRAHVSDLSELILEDGRMRLGPVGGLAAVAAGAPEMHGDDDEDEGQDVQLELEIIEGGALPHAVPGRVGGLAQGGGGTSSCCGARLGGEGREGRRGVWCTCVVCEVCKRRTWLAMAVCSVGAPIQVRGSGRKDSEGHTIITARVRLGDLLLASEEPLDEVGHGVRSTQWIGCGGWWRGRGKREAGSSARRTLTFGSES